MARRTTPKEVKTRRIHGGSEWTLAVATIILLISSLITAVKAAGDISQCFNKTPTITGTSGGDVVTGFAGNDTIRTGRGGDHVHALSGSDRVCGGKGNDTLYGGTGFDRVRGGVGYDRCLDFEITRGCEEVDP